MEEKKKNQKKPSKKLGERVRALRKDANMTQAQLAEQIYVTSKFVGDMENARRSITKQSAKLMADVFQIDMEYLLSEEVIYRTSAEKLSAELKEKLQRSTEIIQTSIKEYSLIEKAIISLASLNGYNVIIQDPFCGEIPINEILSRVKKYMIFQHDGEEVFSLSQSDVDCIGNFLSESFMSGLKLRKKQ